MKKLCLTIVCVCCAFSSLFADDKPNFNNKTDVLDQADQGLRFEPVIVKSVMTLPSVTSQKIQYHSLDRIFINQTIPFPQMVREAATDSKHRRLELRWQVSSLGLYRQLDQDKRHPLLYGGAMIYD